MSQQSIADKAQIIRTETQKYGNTRQRVADVIDDLNVTKANNSDLSSLASSMQNNADNIDSIQQELSDINAEQVHQNNSISSKLDKPNSDGSYYITKITTAGTSYYQYRLINLSSGQIPVSRESYIGESLLYESVNGRIGLATQSPTEKFEVYNGRVKADGFTLTSSALSPLPKEIKFKDGNFVGAKEDGIERKFLMEGDLQTALDSKLNKGSYPGNASDLKTEIDSKLNKPTTTSTTTSYPFVVGEDGNGNSARLPAGDLGKNFFNSDLNNNTARNHTMNAGITVNTLGNPHILSGLPNKNADITKFRKVRVQNASGLDSVVDSKNLLTDGVTSMTDTEKDNWRLAQRKTGENYSTGQPRIDFILPFKLLKNISGIQYFSCIGSNLLLNLSDCEVKLINTSTKAEYPISVVNTSASTTSQFSIGYDISSLPVGSYKVYVRNGLNTNIDATTFDVVDNILYSDMSAVTWQKNVLTSGDITGSTAIGGTINRQSPNLTGEPSTNVRKIEFLSSEILNALEANGNFTIEIEFSRYRAYVHNASYLGLVDSTVNSLNGNGQIMFGLVFPAGGGSRTTLFPTTVTAGGGSELGQEAGKVFISKKGSIIQMMAILSGNIYITTNISQTNSYTGLKLMYFDFGVSSALSGAQQTYSIKLYK